LDIKKQTAEALYEKNSIHDMLQQTKKQFIDALQGMNGFYTKDA